MQADLIGSYQWGYLCVNVVYYEALFQRLYLLLIQNENI